MPQLTGTGLAEFALSKLGMPYFYGSKITYGVLTEKFMCGMHRKFPDIVDDDYLKKAREQKQVGRVNVDCSGLIGAYRGRERSSSQLYATAYVRFQVEKIEDFAVGTVLWKPGHVGIYIGKQDEKMYCVEAKGIDYGTILTKVEDTYWKAGLTFPDIRYKYERKISGTWKGENPYMEPVFPVMYPAEVQKYRGRKVITYGEGVRWLQWELKEAGYSLSIDGIFGEETLAAVRAFQTSCELVPDGIADRMIREYLTVSC